MDFYTPQTFIISVLFFVILYFSRQITCFDETIISKGTKSILITVVTWIEDKSSGEIETYTKA
jgi:hypothetical protein